MKRWSGLTIVGLALLGNACEDSQRMCDHDDACDSICLAYENSVLMSACSEDGMCVCIDSEDLACDASEVVEEGEKAHCEKVCAAVRPGTQGVCKQSECTCLEADVSE